MRARLDHTTRGTSLAPDGIERIDDPGLES